MNPLVHFIKRDNWSKESWYDEQGRLRPRVTCASCKQPTARSTSIIVPKDTLITTPKPQSHTRPKVMTLYRPKKAPISRSPEGKKYLCPECSRNIPSQRFIRGEPPEYTPRFLTNDTLKEIRSMPPIITPPKTFTPVTPMIEPPPISGVDKHNLRKAFIKRYINYRRRS